MSAPGSPNIRMAANIVTLPPGTTTTLSGETFTASRPMQVGRHRLAQRQDAGRGRVAMMTVAQRLDGGLYDMGRGGKIRLADAEVDDVAALAREFRGPGQHREGVLLPHTIEGGDGGKHGAVPQRIGLSVPPEPCFRVKPENGASRLRGSR